MIILYIFISACQELLHGFLSARAGLKHGKNPQIATADAVRIVFGWAQKDLKIFEILEGRGA
jgi:hypothetical protein